MRVLSIDVGNRCGDALLRTFIFVFGLGALALLYFYLSVRYDFLGKGSFNSPHFLPPPNFWTQMSLSSQTFAEANQKRALPFPSPSSFNLLRMEITFLPL